MISRFALAVAFDFSFLASPALHTSRLPLDGREGEKGRTAINARPYWFGRKLQFGRDLEIDRDGTLYYVGNVTGKDLLPEP